MKWVVDTKTDTVYEYLKFAPFSKTALLHQTYYHWLKEFDGVATRLVKPDIFAAYFVELEKKPKNKKKVKKST